MNTNTKEYAIIVRSKTRLEVLIERFNKLNEAVPITGKVVATKDVKINDKEKVHKGTSLGFRIDKDGKVTIDAKPWKTEIKYDSEKDLLKDFKWFER